jgi:ferredoxin-NADP reductase
MWQFNTALSDVILRTPEIKSFRFPVQGQNVDYTPGQFFYVTIKVNDKDAEKHFSFSSSPTEQGYIEFTKRITGSDYSQSLARMKTGDWASVRGPTGKFTLPSQRRKIAFLSGGIGITPMRSILRYITDKKEDWDIVLLDGNSSEAEIAFRDEFDVIASENRGLRVVYALSGPSIARGWWGKTGQINKDVVSEVIKDYGERLFYVSGPPKMVTGLKEQLLALGLPEDQIKTDSFTGYD